MLKYTEHFIKIDETRLHYYRTGGKKPPLILLHGATDNGLCWSRVAEALAPDFDIIMPDAQGHGLSDRLVKGLTHRRFAEHVAGIVMGLGLNKPVIMGHSMGADTAAAVAVEYPSLSRAIILEDPPWGVPPAFKPSEEETKEREAFRNRLTGFSKLTLEEILAEGRKLDPGWSEEDRLVWAKSKQQFDASLFSYPVINERSYTEIVLQIKCPLLLIIGEKGIVTADVAKNAAKLWKSKQPFVWVQIKGATHNIRRDNFPDYLKAVRDFISALPA